ncbi:MAG: hypothetical protein WCN86_02485 [bacterium]
MNPESYRPRNRPQPQNTAEGHQPPSNLNKDKHNKMSIKRKLAAAVLSVLSVVGLAHVAMSSRESIDAVESAEIQRPNSDESKRLEIESLAVGSEATYAEGIYRIDPDELNIRKSAQVRDSEGESNRWNISSGSFVVVNPALADSSNTGYGDIANGPWFMAVDSTGDEFFFVGNRGGITNLGTGEVVKNLSANLGSGKVIATTTEGSVVENDIGENELIATITQG